ncbi:MAG TPA: long-chain fatty acid--CoA ligase [Actinomycetota bacterium]|nr:long-chain fatty acid--CoA ligase [Actinomycetota bacterium]
MHPAESVPNFPYESIGFWARRRADLTPWRVAVECYGRQTTYQQLNDRTNSKAAALVEHGVAKGDRVAVLARNSVEYLEVFFACAKLGAVIVPVNWRLAQPEIDYILQDSAAKLVLTDEDLRTLGDGPGAEPQVLVRAEDPLMIMYTSGTTGRPKGAVLTHGNFFWTNLNMLVSLDVVSTDRSLMVLPMFHIGGWNVNTLVLLWKGATVLLEPAFDADAALEAIERKGVTWMMGVPAVYLFLREHPRFEDADLSGLRFVVCGGAPAPLSLIEAYESRGVRFIQGYGLTEAAPNALCLPAEMSREKLGSAGRPYFYTDVRLADESSEIQLRGPSVMSGYHGLPEATSQVLADGWLRTGDVGRVDDEGYVYVVDRLKDMIITGGENVYPAEVEDVLHAHPGVVEAAVVGVPDERWGESVKAFVAVRQGTGPREAELISWCRERLAGFKCPKQIEFLEALPRTASGKVAKMQLRGERGEREEAKSK